MELIKRVILSLYFYEKKYESRRFFDAWWQFSHSLGYVAIGVSIILMNLISRVLNFQMNPYLYALPIFLVFGITWLKNDFKGSSFHNYVERCYQQIKPVPRWVLWVIAILMILCVAWSMQLSQAGRPFWG
jgi:hypothetical protein